MTALELLARLTERQIDSLFEAARRLPADKLNWKPAPGARSALDQLQEVATAVDKFGDAWEKRRIEWNPVEFGRWVAERSQYTDLDTLEKMTRESYARLIQWILAANPADLTLPVEMPFPGEFTLADILAYAYWNATYHEGQINYIGSLLGESE